MRESSSLPPGAREKPSRPRMENGACDMASMPPARTTLASPSWIIWAALTSPATTPRRATRSRRRAPRSSPSRCAASSSSGRAVAARRDRSKRLHAPAQHRRLLHRRRGGAHRAPGARAGHDRLRQARGHRRQADAVPRRRGDARGGARPGQGGLRRAALHQRRSDHGAGSSRTPAARR